MISVPNNQYNNTSNKTRLKLGKRERTNNLHIYASSVWDPYFKKGRAARFVKNCYTREPGTVANLELNWIPLKERRIISRLTLFHKAIIVMAAWLSQTVIKRRRHLRNSSQNKFIELLPNTETYKTSNFCRSVKDWNALPSEIVNIYSPRIDFKRSYLSISVNDEF